MQATETETATREERDPPTTGQELRELRIRPGDLAVRIHGPGWYYIHRRSPTPASEFITGDDTTLVEAVDCDPDDDVLIGVRVDKEDATPGVEGVEDLRQAVEDGRIREIALPASWMVIALEQFAEAKRDGEWSGVADYLAGVTG